MRRNSCVRALSILATLGALSLVQCDANYRIFRIATEPTVLGADCGFTPDGDMNTFPASQTVTLYEGAEGAYFLDASFGGSGWTIEGIKADGGFAFSGLDLQVMIVPDVDGSDNQVQDQTTVDIGFNLNKNQVTGDFRVVTSHVCIGTCTGDVITNCTQTANFTGTEVDADLEHQI